MEPILDPLYWSQRLREAPSDLPHWAIYNCTLDVWQATEARHQAFLKRYISPTDSILDVGCGWGRLLTLLPKEWHGGYLGVDLSPEFIDLARQLHKDQLFLVREVLKDEIVGPFDWGVLISIRDMVLINLGPSEWDRMQANLKRFCRKLLILEYEDWIEEQVI